MYFPYFITTCISPWKKTWSFILTNLNTLCPMMVCAKCCGHWLSGALIVLEKKVFEKTLINVFSFTGYCLPLEIVLSFILTNFSKGCFLTSLMQSKLALGFLRRRLDCDKFTERRTKGDQKKNLLSFQSGELQKRSNVKIHGGAMRRKKKSYSAQWPWVPSKLKSWVVTWKVLDRDANNKHFISVRCGCRKLWPLIG